MDSHFFRILAAELQEPLAGRRLQKIFGPAPGVVTLDIGVGAAGRFLVLRHGNKEPLFFPASEKPRNPEHPGAHTMWLRKRLTGRRLRQQHWDWPGRRLAWELSGVPRTAEDIGQGPEYLLLCLRNGLSLLPSLPQDFGSEPVWPDFEVILSALHTEDSPEIEALWRMHPHLSPALRKTLAAMPQPEAEALYQRLQQAACSEFFVYVQQREGQSMAEVLPWRLPEPLRKGRDERRFDSAVGAAAFAGAVTLFSQLSRDDDAADRSARKKAHKRLKRSLAKMAQEERRLQVLTELRRKGQAIQAALWQLQPERKLHHLDLPDYQAEEVLQGNEPPSMRIDLDPSLTIAANMERFFRLAAKGERGLPLARARRQALEEELDALRQGRLPQREALRQASEAARPQKKQPPRRDAVKNLAVQRFRTSDGFLLLRGRNKAANHKLVSQAASPYDIWFHAQDGPGAHLVLKRDHPRQDPPRQSLLEAAVLAGLKGWQGSDAKARVICALVKDVRAIKGADLGQVAVDKVLEAFQVKLDPELEERLRVE